MRALVFAASSGDDTELQKRLEAQLDDFDLAVFKLTAHNIYFEANQVLRLARTHAGPIFLVTDEIQPMFAVIVAAKLARFVESFQVMKWDGKRFRVLRVP